MCVHSNIHIKNDEINDYEEYCHVRNKKRNLLETRSLERNYV